MLASSKQGPVTNILHLVSCFIPIWYHLYVPGTWASSDQPWRTLSDPALSCMFVFFILLDGYPAVVTAAIVANSYWVFVHYGRGAVLSMLSHYLTILLENYNALKTEQHSASDNKHCQIESLDTVGHESSFTHTGCGRMLGLCPDPSASFLYASPAWGCTCSSLLQDYPWATGAVLPVGTESRKFTSPLDARTWKLSSLAAGWGTLRLTYPPGSPAGAGWHYLHGTIPETAPLPGFLPSLPCFLHSLTGVPWKHFLTKLFVCRSLSWGLLFWGTHWRCYFTK